MSCYILPAGSSTYVNFATVYQSPMIIGGATPLTWPTSSAASGYKLPAVTGLGTSSCADQLTTPGAIALVTPEVASSLLYQSLCHGSTPGTAASANSLPVAASSQSFCCVAPYSAAVATSGNFPFSVEPFPEVVGGKTVYNCSGMSTFRIVSNDVSQSVQSSTTSVVATAPSCWRRPTGVALGSSPQEFYRLRRLLRRVRRRVGARGLTSADGGNAAGDDEHGGESGSDGGVGRYPLYCVVCRVNLNATAQAKQHYTGRSHARRVRLLYGPAVVTVAGTADDPALQSATEAGLGESTVDHNSPTNSSMSGDDIDTDDSTTKYNQVALASSSSSVKPTPRPMFPVGIVSPVSCDVYCSACAVSFNSTTQARQHYHGKSHAKRLRTMPPQDSASSSLCTPSQTTPGAATTVHEESSRACFVCNAHHGNTHGHQTRIASSQLPSTTGGYNRPLKRCAASVGINGRRRHPRSPVHHDQK